MAETKRPIATDEFYVGYLPAPPPGVGAKIRRTVAALILFAAGLACLLVASQAPFAPAAFEFGTEREFSGRLATHPLPLLWVPRPGRRGPGPAALSGYLLVAPGKHGAGPLVAGLDGRAVSLRGALVHRGDDTMIEVVPGTLTASPAQESAVPAVPRPRSQGAVALRGEIVDGKCFLGVMKPGSGKPHRDCAVRCLSGGAPPLLLLQDASGAAQALVLTGPGGVAMGREVLDFVGEPVAVRGELVRHGELQVLEVDPGGIGRLGPQAVP